MDEPTFKLGESIKLIRSEEQGQIIGAATYLHCEPSYLVRYTAADGRQVEDWWTQSALIRP